MAAMGASSVATFSNIPMSTSCVHAVKTDSALRLMVTFDGDSTTWQSVGARYSPKIATSEEFSGFAKSCCNSAAPMKTRLFLLSPLLLVCEGSNNPSKCMASCKSSIDCTGLYSDVPTFARMILHLSKCSANICATPFFNKKMDISGRASKIVARIFTHPL